MIELDNNYWQYELCYFVTNNGNHYVVKSPEYASKAQVEYIARLFAEMEEAIMSPSGKNNLDKHYTEYVDLDSFVYAYIVAELGRNYDAGSSSMYFYKDKDVNGVTSKIVKGPLWDCDNTLGNFNKKNASSPEGYWAKDRSIWKGLNEKEEFRSRVKTVFENAYNQIFDMIDNGGFVSVEAKYIGTSINMERIRWKSNSYSTWPMYYVYKDVHYDTWQGDWAPCFNFFETYSDGVDENATTTIGFLCEHIEKRVNWLATDWKCNVALRERNVASDDEIIDSDITIDSSLTTDTNITTDSSLTTDTNITVDSSLTTDTNISIDSKLENDSSQSGNSNIDNGDSNGNNTGMIALIFTLSLIAAVGIGTSIILLIKIKKK